MKKENTFLQNLMLLVMVWALAGYGSLQAQVIMPTAGTQTVNVSGTQDFFDSGGAGGSYLNNELGTLTICPAGVGAVSVEFNFVDIETGFSGTNTTVCVGCWDQLRIYNGSNALAPVLATGCGEEPDAQAPGQGNVNATCDLIATGQVYTSTDPSGCLTFVFDSDGSVPETGWAATITAPEVGGGGGDDDPCTIDCPGDITVNLDPGACCTFANFDIGLLGDCSFIPVIEDFTQNFDVSTYTPVNFPTAPTDALIPLLQNEFLVDQSGLPTSLGLESINISNLGGQCVPNFAGTAYLYTIVAFGPMPFNGTLSFDWDYMTLDDLPLFDPFGYVVDLSYAPGAPFNPIDISADFGAVNQSGTFSINLTAGQTFSLYQLSADAVLCQSFTDITNFTFTGEGQMIDLTQISGPEFGEEICYTGSPFTLEFAAIDAETGAVLDECEFDITVNEFSNPTATLACNDNVQVSIDETGCATIGADMILEGGPYGCYDDYIVEVAGTGGSNTVCCPQNLGGPIVVTVTDPDTGNKCWGSIIVEDKIHPVVECQDLNVPCSFDINDLVPGVELELTNVSDSGPQPSFDNSTTNVEFDITLPAGAVVTDVNVALNINHTWVSDLDVFLEGPDGTQVELFTDQCGTFDNVNVLMDDEGAPFSCTGASPAIIGTLQPEGGAVLGTFDGQNPSGTWTVVVTDDLGGDATNIQNIQLQISYLAVYQGPAASDNCSVVDLSMVMTEVEGDCNTNAAFVQTWTATDQSGNTGSCVQTITLVRPSLDDLEVPPNYDDLDQPSLDCSGDFWDDNNDGYPQPEETGFPTIGGFPIVIGDACNISFSYTDEVIDICEGSFKVFRQWLIIDWCTGEDIEHNQLIKVLDSTGPNVVCPQGPITIDVLSSQGQGGGPHDVCTGTVIIPGLTVLGDDCSSPDESEFITELWTLGAGQLLQTIQGNGGVFFNVELIADNPPTNNAQYTVRHVFKDACGNITDCLYDITVVDKVPPVAICDEITEIALTNNGNDGCTLLPASDLDDGSYDNCNDVWFYAAKMNPFLQPPYFYQYYPELEFCCDEAGTQVMVIVLVLDFDPTTVPGLVLNDGSIFLLQGNPNFEGSFNTCMVEVNVEDKLPPAVSCPAPVQISCDEYLQELDAAIQAEDYSLLDQFGDAIFFDNCEPIVTYNVDVNINSCAEGTITRTWSVTDPSGNGPATCSQVISVFHVSDWVVEFPADIDAVCTDGALPDFGEPEIFHDECELIGTSFEDQYFYIVVDACYKIVRTWTVINWCVYDDYGYDVWEEDGFAECNFFPPFTDWDGDGDSDCRTFRDGWNESGAPGTPDGYIDYKQTIKVIDNDDPTFTIPEIDGCIVELDCDKDLTIPYPVIDDVCSPNFEVDITGDFGVFNDVQGDITIDDVVPGTYDIYYTVTDNCGNISYDDVTVVVEDCKKPTPYCKNGLVVELMQTGMVDVWASDLNDNSFDNCPGDLKYSFSPDINDIGITFTCDDLGQNEVEVWVTDAAGNQDFCVTFVIIQDNMFSCNGVSVAGVVETEGNEGVQDVTVDVNGGLFSTVTPNDGSYGFDLDAGGDYSIAPMLDQDHGNGVTTYDLVLISSHILGVATLDSPYKMIAADANNSQSITTLDMVYIRRVILQIDDSFPNNTSWRFVDAAYSFPNPSNPWQAGFPEVINYNNIAISQLNSDFVGVKVGDVNGTAVANELMTAQDRTFNGTFTLASQDRTVKAGETFTVDFTAKEAQLLGYQFTLNFDRDALEFVELTEGVAKSENFGFALLEEGAITASWNNAEARTFANGEVVFSMTFTANAEANLSDLLSINSRYTAAEAYNAQSELIDVDFQLEGASTTAGFALYQNVPNPFKGATMIGFNLPEATTAKLTIMDVSGKVLRVIEAEYQAGYNQVDVKDLPGTGVLYYQLDTNNASATKKMVILN